MTSEKYHLGIVPIFCLFLSGSANQEPEFSIGDLPGDDDDILQTAITDNECE